MTANEVRASAGTGDAGSSTGAGVLRLAPAGCFRQPCARDSPDSGDRIVAGCVQHTPVDRTRSEHLTYVILTKFQPGASATMDADSRRLPATLRQGLLRR